MSNNIAILSVDNSSLQADSQPKLVVLAESRHPLGAVLNLSELSQRLLYDNSTINIVLSLVVVAVVVVVIIIIITGYSKSDKSSHCP